MRKPNSQNIQWVISLSVIIFALIYFFYNKYTGDEERKFVLAKIVDKNIHVIGNSEWTVKSIPSNKEYFIGLGTLKNHINKHDFVILEIVETKDYVYSITYVSDSCMVKAVREYGNFSDYNQVVRYCLESKSCCEYYKEK